ncbi:MAG: hypothetical protein ABFS08_02190 [Pseudomonadota bacterium]
MHKDTLNLVGQIYDAVSKPDKWDSFLENLARAVGAHATRMRMIDNSNDRYSLIAGTGHDCTYDQNYQDYYTKVDLWNPILAQQKAGITFNTSEAIPDEVFRKSEFYNDFYKRYNVFYALGGNIIKTDNSIARIGLHRARSQGSYGDEEVLLVQQLMPHLQRAFKLGVHLKELESQRDNIHDALYRSLTPLLLFDEFGDIAFVNQSAEAIINRGSGLSIHNKRLTLIQPSEQAALQQMVQQAVMTGAKKGAGSGSGIRVTAENGEQQFNLIVTPYPARSTTHLGTNTRICAAVFIHDTAQKGTLSADLLKTLYELTPAEIRLAEGIVDGLTPTEASAKFGVSVATTRTQLRSLFAKTDTQRQAELVRLLSGLNKQYNYETN